MQASGRDGCRDKATVLQGNGLGLHRWTASGAMAKATAHRGTTMTQMRFHERGTGGLLIALNTRRGSHGASAGAQAGETWWALSTSRA